MLKSYEDGMTYGKEGLHERSKFALENTTAPETLSGVAATGVFPEVSLEEVCPVNAEKSEPGSINGKLE